MNWLGWALVQVGFSTAYQLLSRKLAIKSEHPRAFSVVFNLMAAFLSFVLIALEPIALKQFSLRFILLMLVSTVLYALFERSQFYARREIEASRLAVIFRLIPVVALGASVVFLGEAITVTKLVATALVVGGSLLVVDLRVQWKVGRGLLYALVAAFALGLAWTNDKQASVGYSLSLYALLIWWIPIVYNVLIPPIPLKTLKRELVIAGWKPIALLAFVNVFDYYALIKALSLGEASRVIPVTSASTISVVAFGMLFLGERGDMVKKAIAAVLVVAGVMLLSGVLG